MQRNKVFNMLRDKLVFEILKNKLKLDFNKSQTLTLSVRLLCTYLLKKETFLLILSRGSEKFGFETT